MAIDDRDALPPACDRVDMARKVPVDTTPYADDAARTDVRTRWHARATRRMRDRCGIHAHGLAINASSPMIDRSALLLIWLSSFNTCQRNRRLDHADPTCASRRRKDTGYAGVLTRRAAGFPASRVPESGLRGRNIPCYDKSAVSCFLDVMSL
jgi:hypothetical protein